MFAEENSKVDYYKLQNDLNSSSLIDNTYIVQQKNSLVSLHTFSLGGKLIRNNLNFFQKGKNITSVLKGVTILSGEEHVDHSTLVHHQKPNCESHQDYRSRKNTTLVSSY